MSTLLEQRAALLEQDLEESAVEDHVHRFCAETAPALLASLDVLLFHCVQQIGSVDAGAREPDRVDVTAATRGRINGFISVLGPKIVAASLELPMRKLAAPLRVGVGEEFPYVLHQVQDAHNYVMRAAVQTDELQQQLAQLDEVDVVAVAGERLPAILKELQLARSKLLLPSQQVFPVVPVVQNVLRPLPPGNVVVEFFVVRAGLRLRVLALGPGAGAGGFGSSASSSAAAAAPGPAGARGDSLLGESLMFADHWVSVQEERVYDVEVPALMEAVQRLDEACVLCANALAKSSVLLSL